MKIIKQIVLAPLLLVVPLLLPSCLIQGAETRSVSLPPQFSSLYGFFQAYGLPQEIQRKIIVLWLETLLSPDYSVYKEIPVESLIDDLLALSADGKTALSVTESDYKTAIVWDTTTGKHKVLEGHTDYIRSVALSADGKTALTGSDDGTAIVWDATTGDRLQILSVSGGHEDAVSSVVLSADGKTALTGSADYTAIVWDTTTGKELKKFTEHRDCVSSVALSADGKTALTGSNDDTLILWDTSTGKQLQELKATVSSVALSADGKTALIGSSDNIAIVWDTTTGKQLQELKGHTNTVSSVALSADGKTALTGCWDTTAILWDTATGKELKKFTGDSRVCSIAFGLNGDRIAIVLSSDLLDEIILLERISSKGRWAEERKESAYEVLKEKLYKKAS